MNDCSATWLALRMSPAPIDRANHRAHGGVEAHSAGHRKLGVALGDAKAGDRLRAEEPGPEQVGQMVDDGQGLLDHLRPREEPEIPGNATLGEVAGGVRAPAPARCARRPGLELWSYGRGAESSRGSARRQGWYQSTHWRTCGRARYGIARPVYSAAGRRPAAGIGIVGSYVYLRHPRPRHSHSRSPGPRRQRHHRAGWQSAARCRRAAGRRCGPSSRSILSPPTRTAGSGRSTERSASRRLCCRLESTRPRRRPRWCGELGADRCVAIGNGANDALMVDEAALGICVLGPEGSAVACLVRADVVTPGITDALDLLLHPRRLVATLRR